MKKIPISVLVDPDTNRCPALQPFWILIRNTPRHALLLVTMCCLAGFANNVRASESFESIEDTIPAQNTEPTADYEEPSTFEQTSSTTDTHDMLGGFFGLGFYEGEFDGPTIALSLSRSNVIKIVAPISFENVILDYQILIWDFFDHPFQRFFRFNLYFGLGSDLRLKDAAGDDTQKEDQTAAASALRATARIPIGFGVRFVSIPIDAFVEIAPSVEFYDGDKFHFDISQITLGKVAVGARFYF